MVLDTVALMLPVLLLPLPFLFYFNESELEHRHSGNDSFFWRGTMV